MELFRQQNYCLSLNSPLDFSIPDWLYFSCVLLYRTLQIPRRCIFRLARRHPPEVLFSTMSRVQPSPLVPLVGHNISSFRAGAYLYYFFPIRVVLCNLAPRTSLNSTANLPSLTSSVIAFNSRPFPRIDILLYRQNNSLSFGLPPGTHGSLFFFFSYRFRRALPVHQSSHFVTHPHLFIYFFIFYFLFFFFVFECLAARAATGSLARPGRAWRGPFF